MEVGPYQWVHIILSTGLVHVLSVVHTSLLYRGPRSLGPRVSNKQSIYMRSSLRFLSYLYFYFHSWRSFSVSPFHRLGNHKGQESKDWYRRKRKTLNMEKWRNYAIKLNPNIFRGNIAILGKLLHNGPDTIEELLERHVVKEEKNYDSDEDEFAARQRLTSTRREALSLYRDIIRATRFFAWPNDRGVLWRDILRENARREFEEARFEKDPEVITRLLIGGRDAVQAALDKLVEKQKHQMAQEQANIDHR